MDVHRSRRSDKRRLPFHKLQKELKKSFPILQKVLLNSTLFKGEERDCLKRAAVI